MFCRDDLDVVPYLFEAWRRFLSACKRVETAREIGPRAEHTCTGACEMFRYEMVYVCTTSGNYHVCDSRVCTRLRQSHEGRTCELTMITYPLDHVPGGGSEEMYDSKRTTQEKMQHQVKATGDLKLARAKFVIGQKMDEEAPVREMEALAIIKQIFGPTASTLVDLKALRDACVSFWFRIRQTTVYHKAEHRYRYRHHVFVVVSSHRCGFGNIIQVDPQVRKHMPLLKNVKGLEFQSKRFTSSLRMFRSAMAELHS